MKKDSIKRSTIIITMLTLASSILAFGRESYIAHSFGSTSFTDAYYVASIVPDMIAGWIGYTLTRALIPSLKKEISNSRESSSYLISTSFYLTLFIAAILSIVAFIYKRGILGILAPDFGKLQYAVGSELLGIMTIAILFSALSGILWGVHNSLENFSYPALTGVFYNFFYLVSVVLLQKTFGLYSLAIGLVIGTIGRFAIQFIPLLKSKMISLKFRIWHNEMSNVFYAMIPIFFSQIVSQVNQISDRIMASGLSQGQLSNLNFASKLGLLPFGLIGGSIATTLYSRFVTQNLEKDVPGLKRLVTLGLGWVSFFGIVVGTGFCFYNQTLISLFYYSGKFTIEDVFISAKPLTVYGLFAVIYLFIPILVHFFYARNEGKFILYSSAIAVMINVCLSFNLVNYLGIVGLVLANAVAQLIYVIILYYKMIKRLQWSFRSSIKELLNTGALAGIAFLIGVSIVSLAWPQPVLENKLAIALRGFIGLIVGCISILIYCKLNPKKPISNFILNMLNKILGFIKGLITR
ncbi:murein biosynthesis integral membrane protein MurJ [Ectobacillus funiculus]|uniref:Murein biosynthesis integral membrane protein MurJ n=1 Tax=Ectobacillus funiculus TaxID=137993 RepID=A0ABV5WL30_9BACI